MDELSNDIVQRMQAIDEVTKWVKATPEEECSSLNPATAPRLARETLGDDGVRMLLDLHASK